LALANAAQILSALPIVGVFAAWVFTVWGVLTGLSQVYCISRFRAAIVYFLPELLVLVLGTAMFVVLAFFMFGVFGLVAQ
jgi:hypothetical protein